MLCLGTCYWNSGPPAQGILPSSIRFLCSLEPILIAAFSHDVSCCAGVHCSPYHVCLRSWRSCNMAGGLATHNSVKPQLWVIPFRVLAVVIGFVTFGYELTTSVEQSWQESVHSYCHRARFPVRPHGPPPPFRPVSFMTPCAMQACCQYQADLHLTKMLSFDTDLKSWHRLCTLTSILLRHCCSWHFSICTQTGYFWQTCSGTGSVPPRRRCLRTTVYVLQTPSHPKCAGTIQSTCNPVGFLTQLSSTLLRACCAAIKQHSFMYPHMSLIITVTRCSMYRLPVSIGQP